MEANLREHRVQKLIFEVNDTLESCALALISARDMYLEGKCQGGRVRRYYDRESVKININLTRLKNLCEASSVYGFDAFRNTYKKVVSAMEFFQ